MLDPTGERLSTKVYSRIMVEHLHRYAFALEYAAGKVVLDIASGEGYGTNLLATKAKYVYGVDLSEEAVKHATEVYADANKKFLTGSVAQIPLADREVDLVVSFETIEHVYEQDKMMQECTRVMKDEGILIISTPDKKIYSDLPAYKNEFHVKEFYENEFVEFVSGFFRNIILYKQGIAKGGIIYSCNGSAATGLELYNGDYDQVTSAGNIQSPEFMIIVASNAPIADHKNSFFESPAVDSKLLHDLEVYRKKYEDVYHSTTYKIGKTILAPFQKLRSIFNRR